MPRTKAFYQAGDQCVEIPEEFQFDTDYVDIHRDEATGDLRLRRLPSGARHGSLPPSDRDRLVRKIYRETCKKYEQLKLQLRSQGLGFKIMYGEPVSHPPVVILGDQPGGTLADAQKGEEEGERADWPSRNEYAFKPWRLADKLRKVWDAEFLDRCTGLNANFFRARSQKEWRAALPPEFRRDAEDFCESRALSILDALNPSLIVVIGLGTFDKVARQSSIELKTERVLMKRGYVGNHLACGIVHLSGSRISSTDFARLSERLRVLTHTC